MPGPRSLFQREFKCEATEMKMIFYSHANMNHFHNLALSLVLKVRVFGTRKWPITSLGMQRFRILIKHPFNWDLISTALTFTLTQWDLKSFYSFTKYQCGTWEKKKLSKIRGFSSTQSKPNYKLRCFWWTNANQKCGLIPLWYALTLQLL